MIRLTILLIFLVINGSYARQIGETEIISEEGIEVFQEQKFYLLKKNVTITSDNLKLSGDKVKIYFENDLYDIRKIEAFNNVIFESSSYGLNARGEKIFFELDEEIIIINGMNSILDTKDVIMKSNNEIVVNNTNGEFSLKGSNSSLKTETIYLKGEKIDGIFDTSTNIKDIIRLDVFDENISYLKTNGTEMFANKINYNKDTSIMELKDNVKISRDGEIVTGDYGTMNTQTQSYKVKSNNANKVKVIILNKNE